VDARAGELTIAFGGPNSTSNFPIPARILHHDAQSTVFPYFRRTDFASGHDLAVQAVYKGRPDLGAGHDGVIDAFCARRPHAAREIRATRPQQDSQRPVVVHERAPPAPVTRRSVVDAWPAVASQPEVQAALDVFWGGGEGLPGNRTQQLRLYASIEHALEDPHPSETGLVH
jgi:ABC-type phosphate/phosphonate transport system substrate-binding protein